MFYIKTLLIALPIALFFNIPIGKIQILTIPVIGLGGFVFYIFNKLTGLLAKAPIPKKLKEFADTWTNDVIRSKVMGELAGTIGMLLLFSFLYPQSMVATVFIVGVLFSTWNLLIHTNENYMEDIYILRDKMDDEDFWR
jgi:hypothetical protein